MTLHVSEEKPTRFVQGIVLFDVKFLRHSYKSSAVPGFEKFRYNFVMSLIEVNSSERTPFLSCFVGAFIYYE